MKRFLELFQASFAVFYLSAIFDNDSSKIVSKKGEKILAKKMKIFYLQDIQNLNKIRS